MLIKLLIVEHTGWLAYVIARQVGNSGVLHLLSSKTNQKRVNLQSTICTNLRKPLITTQQSLKGHFRKLGFGWGETKFRKSTCNLVGDLGMLGFGWGLPIKTRIYLKPGALCPGPLYRWGLHANPPFNVNLSPNLTRVYIKKLRN